MIKKNQTSQFMKLICWLTFSLSRSCQTFESCGTVIFFFYFTYFYTTYITHVNNKYTVIYLQICLEWTLAIATVHQKEHTMYRFDYSQGFLICNAPQQWPDSCQSETLAERRLYRYFKLLISCYFLHTHTSYRWFFLSKSLMWLHYSYVFFKPMFSICVNSENNVFTTRDALDL